MHLSFLYPLIVCSGHVESTVILKIIGGVVRWSWAGIISSRRRYVCSRVVGPGKKFVAICIPVGLSSGLSP